MAAVAEVWSLAWELPHDIDMARKKNKKTKKQKKNLGVNLTKVLKVNYKMMIKEIEDNINTWKDIPC